MKHRHKHKPNRESTMGSDAAQMALIGRPAVRKNGNVLFAMGGSLYDLPRYTGSTPAGAPRNWAREEQA